MQMDVGMDTGAVLMQESIPIDAEDTAGTLTENFQSWVPSIDREGPAPALNRVP